MLALKKNDCQNKCTNQNIKRNTLGCFLLKNGIKYLFDVVYLNANFTNMNPYNALHWAKQIHRIFYVLLPPLVVLLILNYFEIL
jgi:hypothetical protein